MEFKLRNADKKSVWHEKFVAIPIYYWSKKLNTVGFSGAKSKFSKVQNPDSLSTQAPALELGLVEIKLYLNCWQKSVTRSVFVSNVARTKIRWQANSEELFSVFKWENYAEIKLEI